MPVPPVGVATCMPTAAPSRSLRARSQRGWSQVRARAADRAGRPEAQCCGAHATEYLPRDMDAASLLPRGGAWLLQNRPWRTLCNDRLGTRGAIADVLECVRGPACARDGPHGVQGLLAVHVAAGIGRGRRGILPGHPDRTVEL